MSEKTLYQKLQNIHKKVPYIQKSQQALQYSYAGSSDVLGAIHGLMDEEKLILIPQITNKNTETSQNRKGSTVIFTELMMTMTWVNSDNPDEKLECQWYAQGIDTAGEKGVGKALTYGEKYFLLKFFNVATDDLDPDAFQENAKAQKAPELINDEQKKTLKELFNSMASVTKTPIEKVSKAYLKKVKSDSIEKLQEDTAIGLIELVTNQLNKQTKKVGN